MNCTNYREYQELRKISDGKTPEHDIILPKTHLKIA